MKNFKNIHPLTLCLSMLVITLSVPVSSLAASSNTANSNAGGSNGANSNAATTAVAQQATPVPWSQCCGMAPWPMGPGMKGQGMMGSMPRHHFAMMSGIPAPYRSLTNPLPRTRETVERGATVYEKNCASCHGATDAGDGAAGRNLSPRPSNLAWLAQMPMVQWDPFMYWTVTEGGAQFGTAMPAFKDALRKDDIWAVIAYIQARLPQKAKSLYGN